MTQLAHRSFNTLSGGEKQRVLIARAMAQGADHMILDEPTNHLDIRYQIEVLELVAGLGLTVLAALHDLSLAALFCDRGDLVTDGRVVTGGRLRGGHHDRDRCATRTEPTFSWSSTPRPGLPTSSLDVMASRRHERPHFAVTPSPRVRRALVRAHPGRRIMAVSSRLVLVSVVVTAGSSPGRERRVPRHPDAISGHRHQLWRARDIRPGTDEGGVQRHQHAPRTCSPRA